MMRAAERSPFSILWPFEYSDPTQVQADCNTIFRNADGERFYTISTKTWLSALILKSSIDPYFHTSSSRLMTTISAT